MAISICYAFRNNYLLLFFMLNSQGLQLTRYYDFFSPNLSNQKPAGCIHKQQHFEKDTLTLPLHCIKNWTKLQTIFHNHVVSQSFNSSTGRALHYSTLGYTTFLFLCCEAFVGQFGPIYFICRSKHTRKCNSPCSDEPLQTNCSWPRSLPTIFFKFLLLLLPFTSPYFTQNTVLQRAKKLQLAIY